MSGDNIKKFLDFHHMQVIDDNKRAHRLGRYGDLEARIRVESGCHWCAVVNTCAAAAVSLCRCALSCK